MTNPGAQAGQLRQALGEQPDRRAAQLQHQLRGRPGRQAGDEACVCV